MKFYIHHDNQFYCLKSKYPKEITYFENGKQKKHITGRVCDIMTFLEYHKEYSRNFMNEMLLSCFERCSTIKIIMKNIHAICFIPSIVNLDKGL